MSRRPVRFVLAAVCLTALVGCGSTTVHITTTITRGASATSPPVGATTGSGSSATSTPARSAVAGTSPQAILAAASRALRGSGGYAMQADLRQDGQRTLVDLTTTGARSFDASVVTAGIVTELIGLPGASYLRGNDAFWLVHDGNSRAARARARKLANHWLQVPASGAHSVTGSLGSLAPGTLARCLTEDHGTLSIAGHATVGHTRAVIVKDAGDAPGATPSTIAVATTGTPYPLRYVATGRTRTGGPVDVCNNGKGDDAEGTIMLDQFGQIPPIRAPIGAQQEPGSANA